MRLEAPSESATVIKSRFIKKKKKTVIRRNFLNEAAPKEILAHGTPRLNGQHYCSPFSQNHSKRIINVGL